MAESNMPTTYETKTTTTTSGTSLGLHPEYLRTIPGILKIVEIVLDLITFICSIVTAWPGAGWVDFVAMSAFVTTLIFFIFYLTGIYYKLPGPWMLIILSLITVICSCVCVWSSVQGWTKFVAMIAFIFFVTVMYVVLHLLNLVNHFPGPWLLIILSLITFICSCVYIWGSAQGWTQFVAMTAFLTTIMYVVLHLLNLISRFPGPWLLIEFIYYCVFTVFYLIAAIVCAATGYRHPSIGAAAFFAFAATAVYAVDTFFQFRAWRTGQSETTQTTTTTTTSSTVEQGHATY